MSHFRQPLVEIGDTRRDSPGLEEFADVLMWLLTLANLMEVDMEEVVAEYLNDPGKLPSK